MVYILRPLSLIAAVLSSCLTTAAFAQEAAVSEQTAPEWDAIRQISTNVGEMRTTLSDDLYGDDSIVFEPFQMAEEMFNRDDLVYLMRHGPTDWSKRDVNNVAPTDCENQRIMTDEGRGQMARLAQILGANDVWPSQIVVSQWCRNEQTLRSMIEGFSRVDPQMAVDIPIEVDGEVNLLLSLQGAADVVSLRDRISNWDGNSDQPGPLLIISHYTNIEELTSFRIFEGEALVIDPKRNNRVVGYYRLQSAGPDEGHFADALESPLMDGSEAFQMVEKFYSALGTQDIDTLSALVTDSWIARGTSSNAGDQNMEDFLKFTEDVTLGLTEQNFSIESITVSDDIVTVVGEVTGIHSGEIFGVPGDGREVSFGTIGVHKLEGGQIAESWQITDRVELLRQLTAEQTRE